VIRAFFVAATLLTATVALSAPLELDGSGDHRITVTVAGVKAAGAVTAHGDMLELPLTATDASAHLDADDATVKHIDLIGGAHPRLIVRLHHSKHTTERIAAETVAQDANGGIKVIIPRQPSASATTAAPVAAAPIASAPKAAEPAPIAKTDAAKPAAKPAAKIDATHDAKVEAKADAKNEVKSEAKAPAPIAIVPAEQLGIPVAKEPVSTDSLLDDHKSNPRTAWWVLVALILGVPALLFAQKRRGGGKIQEPLLKVLASQTLGGKAKLMIVEADGKRILLAVNDQTTRVVANLEAAVAAVGNDADANAEADGDDDLDFPIDEAPARAESSFREPTREHAIHHMETSRNDSAVVHLSTTASTATSIPTVSTVSSSSSSAIAGLLKLRADANASNAGHGTGAHPVVETIDSHGPSEWGDALRRAVGRVKS
jgi:flagellar biogenesis protein FliO